uniref:Band 7 domain-containing protein n=1 Tax=Euplotes harpa TaxID=151035 RepID=A0A7S3NEY9_9SPIT|mmetsp:Transcript_39072/g.44703  ORF Transcript_39072/g.44703 Transcript_39072/m.44703 type:complete len:339 (+) Transcript_39072:281-1297(+)
MPYTKIQFLVTQQNFQFDLPVRNCPTIDNIYIQIEVSIILRVRPGEDNVKNFCYKTSVNQLNEQLDAAISERIRVLARSKTHKEAYSIRGKKTNQSQTLCAYMNGLFESKGIEIRSIIITDVILDAQIANQMEEKTLYASKNTLERKQQCFELRVINDEQEYNQRKERMKQERESEVLRCSKMIAEVEQKVRKIEADTQKIIAEINEKAHAEVAKVDAQSELEAQEIISETKMIRASIMADGRALYNKLFSESDAYVIKKNAQAQEVASKMVAEEVKIRGQAEAELSKNLASRRHFDEEMAKLGVLQDLANNDHLSIFGDHKDSLLAQLATFRMLGAK